MNEKHLLRTPSKWKAELLGKDHINGHPYCVTHHGDIETCEPGTTIFDAAHTIVEHIETNSDKMEFTNGIIIRIYPA